MSSSAARISAAVSLCGRDGTWTGARMRPSLCRLLLLCPKDDHTRSSVRPPRPEHDVRHGTKVRLRTGSSVAADRDAQYVAVPGSLGHDGLSNNMSDNDFGRRCGPHPGYS